MGEVYTYKLNSTSDSWELLQIIESVQGFNTYFGYSVDLYGDTMVIGAPGFRPDIYQPYGYGKLINLSNNSSINPFLQ